MVEESNIIRFCEDLADLPLLVERDPDSHGHLDSVPRPVHEEIVAGDELVPIVGVTQRILIRDDELPQPEEESPHGLGTTVHAGERRGSG